VTSRNLAYYWDIVSTIYEQSGSIVSHTITESEIADVTGFIEFELQFTNGSKLYGHFTLRSDGDPHERDYYYAFYDPSGRRLCYYDDREHHPEISTHPHHMHVREDESFRVRAIDIPEISFWHILDTVMAKYVT
jgi:hypothetical protein